MKICIGNDPKRDGLLLYLPTSKKLMGSLAYQLYPTVPYGTVFSYSYGGGIDINLYNTSTNVTRPPSYKKEEMIYFKTKIMQEYQKGKVLVNYWDYAEPVTI